MQTRVENAAAMESLGAKIATCLQGGEIIFLKGDLGAGKTTLTRGLLRQLGYMQNVKSPTFTLVEFYELAEFPVYHFDLYRLNDPEELEDMGIRDYCDDGAICLFEWPERASTVLPAADITIEIVHAGEARDVMIVAGTQTGVSRLGAIDLQPEK